MFGHSHCNANNSEVDVNNGQNKTILKIHPHPGKLPLQTKDGKMAWFFWPSWIQGRGGGGGREGEGGHLLLDFILSKTITPFRNIASGFRLLDQAGHQDI